ncbi:MAG: TonB-dependent receptor [Pyrinomonadaceae bacterium]
MRPDKGFPARLFLLLLATPLLVYLLFSASSSAQDTVTGAFEGTVTNSQTGAPIPGAVAQIINQQTGITIPKRSDSRGRFYQGLLTPGIYTIRVSAPGFQTREVVQRLFITRTGEVVPVPVTLDPDTVGPATPTAMATPAARPTPQTTSGAASGTPSSGKQSTTGKSKGTGTSTTGTSTAGAGASTAGTPSVADTDVRAATNSVDGRRGGAFTEEEVSTLPLGATTLTRTFDELTLLLPGVAQPPQTLGSVAGPGVGAGVGTAGQFAVNGLRSRANNFTVDGSDNNDEDIGVRRQGFLSLIPQSIESIKEYQAITLLAPAQFGRNIGAQVNAVSKSGGSETHGTVYGFFNSSQLNARNFFDSVRGNAVTPLRSGNQGVFTGQSFDFSDRTLNFFLNNPTPITTRNRSGGEDSFTLGQTGFVLGGPVRREKTFYFVSLEGQVLNATREQSFAVPTVAQRGVFGTGASGIFVDPFTQRPTFAGPTTRDGAAIFSLFPFPNDPGGVYGANTFTDVLPASGRGAILSGKLDNNFKFHGRQQSVTGRYNFTNDRRDIPATNGALFSSLRPRVRTQNFSFFFNSEVTDPNSTSPIFNQVRLSYGRTRLRFDELRNSEFLLPSRDFPRMPFLLNAPLQLNLTLPNVVGNSLVANTGPINFTTGGTTETEIGPVGEVRVAGFSPIGVDVFNFPQRRVNNTYQFADQLTLRTGNHSFAFGTDNRRTELNSDLPRNFRPLITFNGAPQLGTNAAGNLAFTGNFVRPEDLAAAGAASGFFQTLTAGSDAAINLRFYQINFFGQDEWRIRPNLSLSYGLRYEYNTPAREVNRRVESSFNDPALRLVPGLARFIGGRTRTYDSDRNNFAPRVGIAYARNFFGSTRTSIFRAGYGLYYDQILGAVVSQSRSVFPRFVTVNVAGGLGNATGTLAPLNLLNPATNPDLVRPGSLNTLNPVLTLADQISRINDLASGGSVLPSASGVEVTLPARRLQMPSAHQYSFSFEQQFGANLVASASYVGTLGRHLIRFTTPNLGSNAIPVFTRFDVAFSGDPSNRFVPNFFGLALAPGTSFSPTGDFRGGRPEPTVGGVSIFETSANSRYDALQLQLRGRYRRSLQYQIAYTLSETTDDVSDVFDVAGASALPQNSLTRAGERGASNFDARHRFSYNFVYDVPSFSESNRALRYIFRGLQIAGTGQFQTGQPFTVNSIFDVNLDGNLTDRLNSVNGITVTGNRRQPLRLTANPSTLLAPIGQDGAIGRNTFRAGNMLELDLSVTKTFKISERKNIIFRTDIFNFTNRSNFGVPVRFLEAPSFGQATDTVTPGRRIQFVLKFTF